MATVKTTNHSQDTGVGLVGTGDIMARGFVPAVASTPGAKVAAVLSKAKSRAERFARQIGCPEAYDDLEEFLASPNVHAVILATPDALHEQQVIQAARAGVHVLCSKPMTSTLVGCLRMKEAVSKAGIVFAMAHPIRSHNAFRSIQEVVQSGRLGKVRFARAIWSRYRDSHQESWRREPEHTHYWALGRHGFHLVDLARWYFGEPEEVQAKISNPRHGGPNDEFSLLILTFPGGLVVELVVSILFAGGNSLEIYGESGVLSANEVFQYSLEQSPIRLNGEPLSYEPNDTFAEQVSNFITVIRDGGTLISDIKDGVRSVEIMELALESARMGRKQIPSRATK